MPVFDRLGFGETSSTRHAEHADEFGIDSGRLAVAGDSAGGNLAAVVALMARDRGEPRTGYQVLLCPTADGAEK